jgi:hypothetical protein
MTAKAAEAASARIAVIRKIFERMVFSDLV